MKSKFFILGILGVMMLMMTATVSAGDFSYDFSVSTVPNNGVVAWETVEMSDSGQYMLAGGYSGVGEKLYRSTDYGATWSDVTPNGGTGDWVYGDVSSTGQYMLAVNYDEAHLYYSNDYGATWSTGFYTATQSIPLELPTISSDGQTWFISETFGSNLLFQVSLDGGSTWNQVNSPSGLALNNYEVEPSENVQSMIARESGNMFIYVSDDRGQTWTNVTPSQFSGLTINGVYQMSISDDAQTMAFLIFDSVGDNSLVYSTDGGASFDILASTVGAGAGGYAKGTTGITSDGIIYGILPAEDYIKIFYNDSQWYDVPFDFYFTGGSNYGDELIGMSDDLQYVLVAEDNAAAADIYLGTLLSYPSACTPSIINTSWSSYVNGSCVGDPTYDYSRYLTQYDANSCGGANVTFWDNGTGVCEYDYAVGGATGSSSGSANVPVAREAEAEEEVSDSSPEGLSDGAKKALGFAAIAGAAYFLLNGGSSASSAKGRSSRRRRK